MRLTGKIAHSLRQAVHPYKRNYRRIPLGLAAGLKMKMSWRWHYWHYLGIYEYELKAHVRAMVANGTRCFDVGAHDGYYTLLLAKLSQTTVLSFECNPKYAALTREVVARNGLTAVVIEERVSRSGEEAHVTLDGAARSYFVPDLIKMDIEGEEVDALAGATGILAERRPHLIIEVHGEDREEQCVRLLRQYAYEPIIVNQRRWLRERRPLAHNRWLVCRGRG